MQNETQTATDNHVSIMDDLTLNEAAAAQVNGGALTDQQGRLLLGTQQGVYTGGICTGGTGTFTLTFEGAQ